MVPSNLHVLDDGPVAGSRIVSAGKIHMLGLETIKTRLGPKWERMSSLVHRYFEAAIRRQLRPGDTFCHSGELTYLVLVRDATLAEAQLKCAVAIEDVCRKLFGEGEEISVRSLVAPIDDLSLAGVQDQMRLSDVLEQNGRETLVGKEGAVANPNVAAPLRVQMGLAPEPVQMISPDHPSFVYRPLWDTSRNVVLTYLSQFLPDTLSAATWFSIPCQAIDSEEDQAALDLLVLKGCLQRVGLLRRAGLRVMHGVPLHIASLWRPRSWSRYSAMTAAVPPELFRDIAFLVHGLNTGVPNTRLVHELPKLSRISKNLFCLVDDCDGVGSQFRNTGVHAVGLALASGHSERHSIARMKVLVREARGNKMDSFILGATTRSLAVNAIGAGVRYVEGPAVRPTVADPKHAFVHEVDDLYRQAGGS